MKSNVVRNLVIGLFVLIVALVVVVMSGTKKTTDNMPSSAMPKASTAVNSKAVATNAVTLQNFAFSPAAITVKVGTTVTWTNQDAVNHSVTSDTADGPKSDLFGKGASYTYTFQKAGTFSYHCIPHPYMKGTVTVTE